MATHPHRFGPLHILDADWRRNTWKRWLRSRLAVAEPQAATATSPITSQTIAPPPPPVSERVETGVESRGTEVRTDARSRFDALCDRLLTLEDSLEALGKRFALSVANERRQQQRVLDKVEMASDAIERQALALESVCSTLERVEQRIERIERCLRTAGGATELRESHRVPPPTPPLPEDDFSDLEEAFSGYDNRSRSVPPEAGDFWDTDAHAGSSIRGTLSDMSLSTVLAMLELERRSGVLKVSSDDGGIVTATLRKGTIVGTRSQEVDVEPVEAIREALRFSSGQFSFRQSSVEVVSGPPRSVGSVVLEATSRNDEASKAS